MRNVVFVAPYLLEATTRFVDAIASLPDVRLGLVSQDGRETIRPGLLSALAAHERVADALDPAQIEAGARACAQRLGGLDRLVGTLEQLQVPLASARGALGLPGLSVEAARNFREKSRMKDVLRAHGLPVARHALARAAADAFAFAQEVGYPLVVKPPEGAGAKATFRVDDDASLREATALFRPGPDAPLLVEEFVTGEEHSLDAANLGKRTIWSSVSLYLPAPLDVLRNPWIQWCVLRPKEQDDPRWDAIRDVGTRALAALGMDTGVSHMEWFRRRDGSPCISEVGARPPGAQFCTLLSHAYDVDFYRAWARLVVFDEFDPPSPRYAAGAAYLRGQGTGRVRAIRGLDEAQKEMGELVVEARLPREGQAPSGGYEGEGYVILRHPDTAVVERALRRLVSIVRVEMA